MYAIVKTGGKQYRVEKGQKLLVERLSAPFGKELGAFQRRRELAVGEVAAVARGAVLGVGRAAELDLGRVGEGLLRERRAADADKPGGRKEERPAPPFV